MDFRLLGDLAFYLFFSIEEKELDYHPILIFRVLSLSLNSPNFWENLPELCPKNFLSLAERHSYSIF